jgi:hypothetical protein
MDYTNSGIELDCNQLAFTRTKALTSLNLISVLQTYKLAEGGWVSEVLVTKPSVVAVENKAD